MSGFYLSGVSRRDHNAAAFASVAIGVGPKKGKSLHEGRSWSSAITSIPSGIINIFRTQETPIEEEIVQTENEKIVVLRNSAPMEKILKKLSDPLSIVLQGQGLSKLSKEQIADWKNAQAIDLSNNNLEELPEDFFETCSKLKFLNLSGNKQLRKLPVSLQNSTALIFCTVSGCGLTELPELPDTLEMLDCSHNQITSLPTVPSSLTTLECSYNPITALPDLKCTKLVNFVVCHCQLDQLPCFPHTLRVLLASNNRLSRADIQGPKFLRQLDLNNNAIQEVTGLKLFKMRESWEKQKAQERWETKALFAFNRKRRQKVNKLLSLKPKIRKDAAAALREVEQEKYENVIFLARQGDLSDACTALQKLRKNRNSTVVSLLENNKSKEAQSLLLEEFSKKDACVSRYIKESDFRAAQDILEEDSEDLCMQGVDLVAKGKYQEALDLFDDTIIQNLFESGKYQEATAVLQGRLQAFQAEREAFVNELCSDQSNMPQDAETVDDEVVRFEFCNLSYNKLEKMPDFGESGERLEALSLAHNCIEEIFDKDWQMIPLVQELYVNNNQISAISKGISTCTELRVLNACCNQLVDLSDDGFFNLPRITILDVSDNRLLASLPETIGGMWTLDEKCLLEKMQSEDVQDAKEVVGDVFARRDQVLFRMEEKERKRVREKRKSPDCEKEDKMHVTKKAMKLFHDRNGPCLTDLNISKTKITKVSEYLINSPIRRFDFSNTLINSLPLALENKKEMELFKHDGSLYTPTKQ